MEERVEAIMEKGREGKERRLRRKGGKRRGGRKGKFQLVMNG